MKKVLFVMMAAAMMVSCGNKTQQAAQSDAAEVEDSLTGAFTAYDLDGFKLHVYNTNDVMGDASYIIEGQDSLIVMEYPLFKVNAKEFADYIEKLDLWWHDEAVCLTVWRHDGRVAHAEGR